MAQSRVLHYDLGCFLLQWKMELGVAQGQQMYGYVEMLKQASLKTEGPCLSIHGWVFQKDNTAVHNGKGHLPPGE